MPSITISKKLFEGLVGKKLPLEELKERISLLGTDLDGIEGDEISVEIFPNRPDMLSEHGFARAFASFIGTKPGLRRYKAVPSGSKVIIEPSVSSVRPYTACAIVRKLKFDDEKIKELVQIQEKLHITYGRNRKKAAIGIYPLEHIKLPIYYRALPPEEISFRPLEGKSEMTGLQILSRHPAGRDYAHLLEGEGAFPIFIDAADNILSMPPIINSELTGRISADTTDVFIECSGFDYRTLSLCLNMIVTTLSDMGGTIEEMTLKYPDKELVSPQLSPMKMELDPAYVNRKLGLELSPEKMKDCLERMGHSVEIGRKLMVSVPPYRVDILHPIDLCEDLAIGYGYDNFEAVIPRIATIAEENPEYELQSKAASVFVGMGFQEALSYNLSNDDDQQRKMLQKLDTVSLASAVNIEYNVLRASLMPGLLNVFVLNRHHEYPQRVFEIGTVFSKSKKTETGVQEDLYLSAMNSHRTADFTEAKQQLDALLRAFDMKYETESSDHPSFIPGRSAKILVNGTALGWIGEMNPQVLENFELGQPVSGFELNLSSLFEQLP